MKIVVTGLRGFPGVQGGVENHCEHLYPNLVKEGCDITVFARSPYVRSSQYDYKGVSLVSVDCSENKFLEAFTHTFKCVLKAVKYKPDILHIHAIGPSFYVPLARLLRMKVVVTNHGPDYMREKWPYPAKLFLRLCEWSGARFANNLIAVADNIAEDLANRFGKEVASIPNGVNMPDAGNSQEYLVEKGIEKGKYILAVGRFVPEKGFDDLINAFSSGDYGDWKLVIAGDADHEDKYSRGLKEKASSFSNIVLTGYLSKEPLSELYSNAGLFVLPSYHEGLPIVLLEAMSYGLSCLASNIPANRNVELGNERFFEAGDAGMLAAKMKEFINKKWSTEQRQIQVDMINNNYNWERISRETVKVYRKTLA